MNTLLHINAFLLVARVRSFSAAARELGVAPSVVTKRITRLEEQVGTQLIVRSTRGLSLTAAGEQLLPQFTRLIAELEETIKGTTKQARGIEGHLRIKAPTTVTSQYLGRIFSEFQARNRGVSLEIVLLDRSVIPASWTCRSAPIPSFSAARRHTCATGVNRSTRRSSSITAA
jgi:DNA-binding transcriptional LysR family regulator